MGEEVVEEMSMCSNRQPSKECVRRWLHDELRRQRPPPGPEQIRRELGWVHGHPPLHAGGDCHA
jgi:hypothetical protein